MQQIFVDFSQSYLASGNLTPQSLSDGLKTVSNQYAAMVRSAYVVEEDSSAAADDVHASLGTDHADRSLSSEDAASVPDPSASRPSLSKPNPPLGAHVGWRFPATAGHAQLKAPTHASVSRTSSDSSSIKLQGRDPKLLRNDSAHDDESALIRRPLLNTVTVKSPFTYSFQETSLARRLHRSTIELAYHLACNPTERPHDFQRAFALTMKYAGTVEHLQEHFAAVLKRGVKESLHVWGAPFIHIGGAGTHYPRAESSGDWTERPNLWNVRSIGPQNLIGEQDDRFTPDAALHNTPNFDGIWFDSHDVEGYLTEKGIFIDAQSSFADITVPMHDLVDSTTPKLSNESTPSASSSTSNPQAHLTLGYHIPPQVSYPDMQYAQPFLQTNMAGYSNTLPGSYMDTLTPSHSYHSERSSMSAAIPYTTTDHYSSIPAQVNVTYIPQDQSPQRANVTIDVAKFIKGTSSTSNPRLVVLKPTDNQPAGLGMTASCLGRTPGFRRGEVDKALRAAIVHSY